MRRRIVQVFVAMVAAAGLAAAGAVAAHAVITAHTASSLTKFQARSGNDAWVSSAANNVWVDVPGSAISVVVPSGTARMQQAIFSAESSCNGGTTTSWCAVRVVRVNAAGTTTELSPVVGTDFAFDSSGGDMWQSGAINRFSGWLGAGTYTYKVQVATVNGATSFRIDDWGFSVNSFAP